MSPLRTKSFSSVEIFIVCGIVAYVCFFVYGDNLHFPFHFDDFPYIVHNQSIKSMDFAEIWAFMPARFLSNLTLAANYQMSHYETFSYHVVNNLIHVLNSILVLILVLMLCRSHLGKAKNSEDNGQAGLLIAPMTALLFASHPIQTQAVNYIWQRSTLMTATFYLLTMILYLWSRQPGTKRRGLVTGAAVAACALAMFIKQNAFTLPFALVLLELAFVRKDGRPSSPVAALWPFVATLAIIPIVMTFAGSQQLADVMLAEEQRLNSWTYFLTQPKVIVSYLKLMLFPAQLTIDHNVSLETSPFALSFLLPTMVLLSILAGAGFAWKRSRLVFFGIGFFFLALAVESSFLPLEDYMFEHRAYLPSVGFFVVFSAGCWWVCSVIARTMTKHLRLRLTTAGLLTGVLVLPFASLAHSHSQNWSSAALLWSNAATIYPDSERSQTNLGSAYLREKQFDLASMHYKKALDINPSRLRNQYNYGFSLCEMGQYDEAVETLTASLKSHPERSALLSYGLGETHRRMGNTNQALSFLNEGYKNSATPQSAALRRSILLSLHTIFLDTNQLNKANRATDKILKIYPNDGATFFRKGLTSERADRDVDAVSFYKVALELDYRAPEIFRNLTRLLVDQGDKQGATAVTQSAKQFHTENAQLHHDLSELLKTIPQ